MLLVSLMLSTTAAFAANKGGGTFRLATNKLTVKHVCAYRVPSVRSADGKPSVSVFLTSHPIDCASLDGMLDPLRGISASMREVRGGFISVQIDSAGAEAGLYFDTNEPSDSFNTSGSGEFKTTVNTAQRTEGTWFTKEPKTFFDKTFEFKLNWAADILSGATDGKPLPAGGGDPGKAFLAFVNAVNKKDHKTIKAYLGAERAGEVYSAEGTDYFNDSFKYFRDAEMVSGKVLSGWIDGDRATLKMEGKTGEGNDTHGYVQMLRAGGAWKLGPKEMTSGQWPEAGDQ
jgi:hypothetical protein